MRKSRLYNPFSDIKRNKSDQALFEKAHPRWIHARDRAQTEWSRCLRAGTLAIEFDIFSPLVKQLSTLIAQAYKDDEVALTTTKAAKSVTAAAADTASKNARDALLALRKQRTTSTSSTNHLPHTEQTVDANAACLDEEIVYEVEAVVGKGIARDGKTVLYCVKWVGWDSEHNTWQTAASLDDARDAVIAFEAEAVSC